MAFIAYMAVLIYFLFFSEDYGRTGSREFRYNLTLFAEIRRFIRYREVLGFNSFFINVLGNVLAFVPFGFVLPLLHQSNKNFWYVLVTGFQFSLLVELVQLVAKVGIFDVDDIFLNTLGAVLGYVMYAVALRFYRVYMKRVQKRRVNV
jgi:glycopeptide antibiotics resistance protein